MLEETKGGKRKGEGMQDNNYEKVILRKRKKEK